VKIQVEFNPTLVESYRLIGYENRLLNAEDFNDDTKDAGEIGAGHSVTALYEVVLKGENDGNAPSVDPLRYQDNKDVKVKHGNELLTVKFRYKAPDGDVSKLIERNLNNITTRKDRLSNNFKFSSAVAGFGMLLRASEYKGSLDFDRVIEMAKESKGDDENGYRAEFIRLAEAAKIIYE
jgi:Ca-activated chloride channel family protein